MQISGTATFQAPPERVYRVFTDKDALARVTPGIQTLEQVSEQRFEAVMKVGVAGITGTYKASLEIQDQRPPEQYTLALAGDGPPGFVRGTAQFAFAPTPDGGTEVRYQWDVQVGGMVAGVGQRVLGGVARMLIGQFMSGMQRELAG